MPDGRRRSEGRLFVRPEARGAKPALGANAGIETPPLGDWWAHRDSNPEPKDYEVARWLSTTLRQCPQLHLECPQLTLSIARDYDEILLR